MKKSIDQILLKVQKPSRYTGNELNMVKKDLNKIKTRFAICFPDIYDIGMSHLGIRILYHVINKMEEVYCERAFSVWPDLEKELIENNIPLFSLETKQPLSEFDFLGFTLQYELSYTNILNMLKLSNVPLLSSERTDNDPLIIAGGPCALNPEPLADFIDFFVLGESEEAVVEMLKLYNKNKEKGRREFLKIVDTIEGVYVPSNPKKTVKRRIIKDLDNVDFPVKAIVPYIQIVHDRASLELFRGCIRGCRFCQAGYIYRPVREKKASTLLKQSDEIIKETGYEEISLGSLSTSDYSQIEELTEGLMKLIKEKRVNLSLPSLRVDSFSLDLTKKMQNDRKSGLTFAPEAGTDRLRAVINKGISEEDILSSVKMSFASGYRTLKLYFMLGLPTETISDVEGILLLVNKIIAVYIETTGKRGGLSINVSTAFFVPKPFTPFQWEPQERTDDYLEKVEFLKKNFNRKYVSYSWHDPKTSYLEALFARGDRRVGKVILNAFNKGSKFDAWREFFDFNKWMDACNEEDIDPDGYITRRREISEDLPWDFIDIGVTKEFLIKEKERAEKEEQTINCRDGCANCGLLTMETGVCVK